MGNYWDRLARIIESLVSNKMVKDESEFYEHLKLDKSVISDIKAQKIELPPTAIEVLRNQFNVGIDYLKVGLGTIFHPVTNSDICIDDEEVLSQHEVSDSKPIEEKELSGILLEALELSKLDLKNKGHISESE